jgi:hypothetical protein
MAVKDLMVHLDQDERTPIRLDLAVSLARQHGARPGWRICPARTRPKGGPGEHLAQ